MSLFTRSSDDTAAQRSWTPGEDDLFRLSGPVGTEAANDRDDVIRAQILLNHAGAYDMERLGGPTGWAGGELVRGLRKYQRDRGLTVDGLMLPDGETIEALRQDFSDALAGHRAPTADQVEQHHDILAQHRAETDGDAPPPRTPLVMPGETLPAYVQRPSDVMSDVGEDGNIAFKAGRRVSQAVPMPRLPLGPVTGIPLTNPYLGPVTGIPLADAEQTFSGQTRLPPGVTPEMAKAGRLLEQKLGDTINLLTLPVQVMNAINNDGEIRLPSILLDPALTAATKTPPRMPSAPEDPPPEGSKPEEREPTLEELIPPEMKPWAEGLEPFDRQLARELLLIYNRRGGPETIQGNAISVKETLDAFKKYPALAEGFDHVGGSHSPIDGKPGHIGGEYRKEKHFVNAETKQPKGGSWADITFKARPELAKELGFEYLHLSSAQLLKDGKTAVSHEREKRARLEKNDPGSRVEFVEKPTVTRINGQKIPYDWESYNARIKAFAERLAEEIEAMRAEHK